MPITSVVTGVDASHLGDPPEMVDLPQVELQHVVVIERDDFRFAGVDQSQRTAAAIFRGARGTSGCRWTKYP